MEWMTMEHEWEGMWKEYLTAKFRKPFWPSLGGTEKNSWAFSQDDRSSDHYLNWALSECEAARCSPDFNIKMFNENSHKWLQINNALTAAYTGITTNASTVSSKQFCFNLYLCFMHDRRFLSDSCVNVLQRVCKVTVRSSSKQVASSKNTIFWGVTECDSCKNRRFGRKLRLRNQDRKKQRVASYC
jgi:hypothetical protein